MDSKITILENEFANMWYYPDKGIIHHKLLQPIKGEDFRDLLMAGLTTVKKYGAQKWLSDDRKNAFVSAEDSAWSQDFWLPQSVKAGWKYWAMIPPEKVRGQINMQRLIHDVDRFKIVVEVFSSPNEALDWLVQQGNNRD